MSREILLVTPVWNDSIRLAVYGIELAEALAQFPHPVRWVIADDGSGGEEPARLHRLRDRFAEIFPNVEVHLAAKHLGKGGVVREAWSLAPEADWLAFVDADGSVTADDFLMLLRESMNANTTVLGIRKHTQTTRIVESPWRAVAHRGFLVAARLILGIQCEDPQCGGKVLRGDQYRSVAGKLRENGLAFDSELLHALAADGSTWREVPVNWVEKKGGKVKPLRDAWAMLGSLIRIRLN